MSRMEIVSPATPRRTGIASGARIADEASEAAAATNVQAMFNSIAPSYDRLNHLLSFGLDRLWWRRCARKFSAQLADSGAQIVDICCGTGDMTAALLRERRRTVGTENAHTRPVTPIVGLDFSAQMLARARAKFPAADVLWVEGDAMRLPFADGSVQLVTAAFGFRNLTSYDTGLREIFRVLAPGGRIGILEANQPERGLSALVYNTYFHHILPLLGGVLSGHREAYAYLPASVARFPRPPQMLTMMQQAGFASAAWDGYLFSAAGLYHARKP